MVVSFFVYCSLLLGEDSHFDYYVSIGLKPKISKDCMINESNFRNFRVIGDQRITVNAFGRASLLITCMKKKHTLVILDDYQDLF